jgi:K+ transporter
MGEIAKMADTLPAQSTPRSRSKTAFSALALGALGVVFGDIGTSPLYAFKQCFLDTHVPATARP